MKEAHRRLREATAHAHEAVDAAFARYDLTDRDSYARFLSAHAAVMIPLEAALNAAGAEDVTPDWGMRKRGHLLLADLAALNAQPFLPQGVELSSDTLAPDGSADTAPALAGVLYVAEGSRLGGRFLARRVPAGFPKAYLDAHQPAGNWAKLLASLDQILYDEPRTATAIAAALEVFALFERAGRDWLVDE